MMLYILLKYALATMLGLLVCLYFAVKPLPADIDPLIGLSDWEILFVVLCSLVLGTSFFLLLSRIKISFLFGALDIAATTIGMSITLFPFFSMLGLHYILSLSFAGLLASVVSFSRERRLKNMVALLTSAGIGALLGSSLSYWLAIGLGGLLVVYDYIAVKKTGHMIELVETIYKHEMSMMVTSIEEIRGEECVVCLGAGDFALPTAVACSFLQLSIIHPFVFLAGCMLGLFAMFSKLQKGEYAPALPYLLLPGLAFSGIYHFLVYA